MTYICDVYILSFINGWSSCLVLMFYKNTYKWLFDTNMTIIGFIEELIKYDYIWYHVCHLIYSIFLLLDICICKYIQMRIYVQVYIYGVVVIIMIHCYIYI